MIRADVPFGVPLNEVFIAQNMGDAGISFVEPNNHHCNNPRIVLSRPSTRRVSYRTFWKGSTSAPTALPPPLLLPLLLRVSSCAAAPWLQWHLGFYQRAYTPLERGFDEHLGYYQGCVDYYKHTGGGYGGMEPGTGE